MSVGDRPGGVTGRFRALGRVNLAYDVAARVHVCVHGKEPPADAEWQAYLEHVRGRAGLFDGVLLVALNSGPTDAQRDRAVEFWKAQPPASRIAVLTNSAAVARMAGSLKWFMPDQIKSFAANAAAMAYDHLGLSPSQVRALDAATQDLHKRLGL